MLLIRVLVLFLGVLCEIVHGSTTTSFCYGYLPTNTTYKIFHIPKTWNQAKHDCEKEGSILFYPQDRTEASAIIKYYLCESPYYFSSDIFIGVADWIVADIFVTVDGQPISDIYNNWLSNEPKNGGKNGCVILQPDKHLREVSCNERHPYICKRLKTQKSNDVCNVLSSGYQYDVQQKACYKIYLTPRNWTDAVDTCKSDGSYLAVINSQEEADYLVSIIVAANPDKVKGDYVKNAVYVGFKKDEEGISLLDERTVELGPRYLMAESGNKWVTVTKGALQDSGYNKWGISHRVNQNANCGVMFHNGLLNAVECHQKLFFICEYQNSDFFTFSKS